jgi:hypothetical protein
LTRSVDFDLAEVAWASGVLVSRYAMVSIQLAAVPYVHGELSVVDVVDSSALLVHFILPTRASLRVLAE